MIRRQSVGGFTIIEVMLFLAITGLMLAGIFTAVSGTINRQRYHDATTSFTDYLQGQYNLVDNVRSNRIDGSSCGTAGITDASSQFRGTSNCSIVGRYITTQNGLEMTSQPIYATRDITRVDMGESEAVVIDDLGLQVAPDSIDLEDKELYKIPWGTFVYTDGNAAARDFRIALVKLPTNGLIRTYFTTTPGNDIASVIAGTADEINLCVESGGLVASPVTGAKLLKSGSNVNAVQPIIPSEGGC